MSGWRFWNEIPPYLVTTDRFGRDTDWLCNYKTGQIHRQGDNRRSLNSQGQLSSSNKPLMIEPVVFNLLGDLTAMRPGVTLHCYDRKRLLGN
jgi:hypothetical protein